MDSMILHLLKDEKLISPPGWLPFSTHFLVKTGSHAYGIANKDSDIDIIGFCIPPKEDIFPHLRGEISGFGRQTRKFEQYQQTDIHYQDKVYDITIYNIVKFFQLLMDNNPNIIDSIFVPAKCIIFSNEIGNHVRSNRQKFLHKGAYHRFLGYAYSQLSKIENKNPIGKRKAIVDKYGFDTKYASHLVRLAIECEEMLINRNIDLDTNSELLLAIRNGEIPLSEILSWFEKQKLWLAQLYETSKIPHEPDEQYIKQILIKCLEMKFGSLEKFGFIGANDALHSAENEI